MDDLATENDLGGCTDARLFGLGVLDLAQLD